MNWNNLKENKCPKCGKRLLIDRADLFKCEDNTELKHDCDFHIWKWNFEKIINNLNK
jgi:hypothetical protein